MCSLRSLYRDLEGGGDIRTRLATHTAHASHPGITTACGRVRERGRGARRRKGRERSGGGLTEEGRGRGGRDGGT